MARGSNYTPFVLAFSGTGGGSSRAAKAPFDGYPPFNVERLPGRGSGTERLRITLAVAGFSVDQIEIVHEREQLVIRGRQKDERERLHLHRGIATRQFQRVFLLAETMRVALATLDHGLLSVELAPRGAEDVR